MHVLAKFVMQGQYQAIVVAGLLGGVSLLFLPMAIFSAAFVALYFLRKGGRQTLPVVLGTGLIVMACSFFVEARPGLGFPVVIALLIPVWISARVLRATSSQGSALVIAVSCAAVFAVAVHLFTGDAVQWWSDWLKLAITGVNTATYQGFEDSGSVQKMNGIIAMLLSLATIGSLFIARWMQAKLYLPGGFKAEFILLRVHRSVIYSVAVILAIMVIWNKNLYNDLLMVFAVIYFFQGLAVLHCNVEKLKRSQSYLLPPYVLMIFIPHYVFVGMAGLGIVDNFFNFRKL